MDDELHARLKAYEGRPAAVAGTGRDPVNAPMIRHWCEATGDRNPAYTGPGAIAPPTMLQAWIMGGLSGHEGRAQAYDELLSLLDGAGCTSVVATDCEQEYLRPLRPGDEVAFDTVIESVSQRKTTKLGTGYFVTTRTDVRVGEELVGTHRFRILKYAPSGRTSSGRPSSGRATDEYVRSDEHAPHKHAPTGRDAPHKHAPTGREQNVQGRQEAPRRPRPVVNRDNAGFWEGVRCHRLLVQRCTACDTLRFPWLPGCNACGSARWDTVEAGGEGTVFSYVVMHHPPFPAFSPPYAIGLIELAEGVRIISNVVDVPYDKVRIGMPVELEFRSYDDEDGELVLPVFRPRAGEAAA
ncbi:bifunctional MaoC family dehydratase N-terminal/OB-fold nucleic acid binding domain-containing protein [Streptomyces zaehneri]|uniref:bifunctional MaoC family dehydratase N-terminal/OB-fold nucleic acid binding domain-containing protein n=1 Tax=Streptomyces zaehneri TaxID=3051180 RepID=UPI0028D8E83E|nr:bifunctional MaoC family dehydratase N-terminal/OB-fold nucleic acid binding domain-containing protein [Streptomyces sp. DSM 40713]